MIFFSEICYFNIIHPSGIPKGCPTASTNMVKTNYQMKRTLLLAVFGLLAAAVSATDFTCTPEGGLATEGARLVITPYCAGWNSAGVQGTWDNMDCPDRPFRIMDGDSCLFEGNSQWVAEGSLVVGHILLTCQNDCDMESLSMALFIPQSRTRGKALNADGETFTLPLNSNLTLTTCTVPLPQGRTLTLSWDAPTLCHAEDLSQWGDEWTLRIGQWQTRHTFRKGDKVMFTVAATDKEASIYIKMTVPVEAVPEGGFLNGCSPRAKAP